MNNFETRRLIFRKRAKRYVNYHEAFVWTEMDRHKWIGKEWIATKRAMKAERELEEVRKSLKRLLTFANNGL